ncbi:MAG: FAD-dependent oxidoreductase [bacterium]|nr:FAD-dependent oxidoreductase [bacterium]
MKAKIKDKKEIAQGTLMATFDLQGKEVKFKPGQYFYITLKNPPYHDSKGAIRHFSIVNSPNEKGIITMATRIRDSAFKKSLSEMPIGSEVEIDSIGGSFVLPSKTDRPLVFFAGGIGVTPFMSMFRYIKEEKLPYKILFIYSNRDQSSTAFYSELKRLNTPDLKIIFVMTQDSQWKGENRHIDQNLIRDYAKDLSGSAYYLAGPQDLVKSIFDELIKAGVKLSQITTENFSGY